MLPFPTFADMAFTNWKMLKDKYKKTIGDHKDPVRQNVAASGITELRGKSENIVDDVMKAVEEFDERRLAERDESAELDRRLSVAGEEILNCAVRRARNLTVRSASNATGVAGKETVSQNKNRNAVGYSDDEYRTII